MDVVRDSKFRDRPTVDAVEWTDREPGIRKEVSDSPMSESSELASNAGLEVRCTAVGLSTILTVFVRTFGPWLVWTDLKAPRGLADCCMPGGPPGAFEARRPNTSAVVEMV